MDVIKSISYSQTEIIRDILKLHVPQGFIDCDCTYSTGVFYRDGLVQEPKYKFDINPSIEGVEQADCRELPLKDASISCLMFDPPFLWTKGSSLNKEDGNIINKRFSVYPTAKDLYNMYCDALDEAYRVLRPHGILIFKCQDRVASSKQYMSHVFVCNTAVEKGFYPRDLFILLAKTRLIADWQTKNQQNARKYHSYFWVFEKDGKHIQYI